MALKLMQVCVRKPFTVYIVRCHTPAEAREMVNLRRGNDGKALCEIDTAVDELPLDASWCVDLGGGSLILSPVEERKGSTVIRTAPDRAANLDAMAERMLCVIRESEIVAASDPARKGKFELSPGEARVLLGYAEQMQIIAQDIRTAREAREARK